MTPRNAYVTPHVTLASRSGHYERLETRDKRLEGGTLRSLRERAARPQAGSQERGTTGDFVDQDACIVWYYCSAYPGERGRAGRTFTRLLGRGLDPDELLPALAEFAITPNPDGQPHHAHEFTELAARAFIATIRERARDMEKAEEREEVHRDRPLHRLSVAAVMGRLGLEVRG